MRGLRRDLPVVRAGLTAIRTVILTNPRDVLDKTQQVFTELRGRLG